MKDRMKTIERDTGKIVRGAKGGSASTHTPKEDPDSLNSIAVVRMLLALGEGEFESLGTDDLKKRVMLGGTPIQNQDGSYNFSDVTIDYRPGTSGQAHIAGLPAVESETAVGVDLKASAEWTQALTNTSIDAVRVRIGIPTLVKQEKDGDRVGSRIDYTIMIRNLSGGVLWTKRFSAIGKTTTLYERDHRIDLPASQTGWIVAVRRDTPDSENSNLVNKTQIQAYTEIVDLKLSYPHTALLFVEFNAKLFSSIPKISIKARGRKIQVPTNYDPVLRTYSGTWDGSFKRAWSNNPAWVFYDCATEPRFALGNYIDASMLDKWTLYTIAQRCDQLVPDGAGGQEPRFLCDVYIQSRGQAWTVLKDLAAVFSGMTYWGVSMLNVLSDRPGDVTQVLTRASVIEGKFTRRGGSKKNRKSVANISWDDPSNHYDTNVAVVPMSEYVNRYGWTEPLELSAIGCTRLGEAQRRGKWALITNVTDGTTEFSIGMEGIAFMPGDIIGVADDTYSGGQFGGRIVRQTGTRGIILDRAINSEAKANDYMFFRQAGDSDASRFQIAAISADRKTVTMRTDITKGVNPFTVWVADTAELAITLHRVVSVTWNEADNTFAVVALDHDPSKYDAIDLGAHLDDRPTTLIPPGFMKAPQNITLSTYETIVQGTRQTTLRTAWDRVDGAVVYDAQWRRDDNDWINVPSTSTTGFEVSGIFSGDYWVRVRATNSSNVSSPWGEAVLTGVTGREGEVPVPTGLKATSQNWAILWQWTGAAQPDTSDVAYTELQYSVMGTSGYGPYSLLSTVPFPSNNYTQSGLGFGQYIRVMARYVDRLGNKSAWSEVVEGFASEDAEDYLAGITDDLMSAEDGKILLEQINTTPEAIYESMLTDYKTILDVKAGEGNMTARIQIAYNVAVSANEAVAQLETLVGTRIDDAEAAIHTLQTAQTDLEQSFAQYQTTVSAKFGTVDGKIAAAEAAISVNQTAIANDQQALATYKTQVAAQFQGQSAAIEQKMTSQFTATGGSAIYSLNAGVTFNGVYYDAGMTLSTIANGSGVISRIAFKATQFLIAHPTTGGLFTSFAVIGNDVFIDTARIQNASIAFAKISDSLQSSNFVSAQQGWRLLKDGTFEINSLSGNGRLLIQNNQILVYDSTGRLRVRFGLW
ncbi:MAG: hypothetical protein [Caudoviricetes sp.]|nr:MAG: hypothetical protein [Caudoviricetes sp.]